MKYNSIKRYHSQFKERYLYKLARAIARYRQQILFRGINFSNQSINSENIDISEIYYGFNYSLPVKKQLDMNLNDPKN